MSHPSLTPAEAERLEMLIEECSEVIKEASKVLRHGWDSYHPDDPRKTPNSFRLQRELTDVDAVRWGMALNGDPVGDHPASRDINDGWTHKHEWTHHQRKF